MRILLWFRSDLRCEDNPALRHAAERAQDGVVAVFLIAQDQWQKQDWGTPKTAFMLRNVEALSKKLEELNISLIVAKAPLYEDAAEILLKIARTHQADALFYEVEEEIWETRRDEAVKERFENEGLEVVSFDGRSILPPPAIQKKTGGYYSVFTPYHRSWLQRFDADPPEILSPPKKQSQKVGEATPRGQIRDYIPQGSDCIPQGSDYIPQGSDYIPQGSDREDLWPAGEDAAQERLDHFLEDAAHAYHERRDTPNHRGTSCLSPYLSAGVLSPRIAYAKTLVANEGEASGGNPGLSAWLRQLVWRDFYRHVLVGFPRVCKSQAFKPETEALRWANDEDAFEAWREGRTGVPIVDAGMRQLLQTGWMHNRLRMITAMFLTKDLRIDWRRGERHFMQHLVDADLAQNNGGWQWAASTGTDAVPYFRIFNPWTQGKRFDADGSYIRRFVPELMKVAAKSLHDERAVEARTRVGYPEPIIDHGAARKETLAAWKELRDQKN